jgi:hypothetical protein
MLTVFQHHDCHMEPVFHRTPVFDWKTVFSVIQSILTCLKHNF